MRDVFLWTMAGALFAGAWASAHYSRFNDAAEFVTVAVLCVIVAMLDVDGAE